MTVDEIFATVGTHMVKGLMIHEELANYYDFLGLKGYSKCHEYHYMTESCTFRKLNRYYIDHYNSLIPNMKVETPEVIPASWYRYERNDVDTNTKRTAVKNGLEMWVNWERETKQLYEQMYSELMRIGEVSTAVNLFSCFIKDVDDELKRAYKASLNKKSTGYDINAIESEQYHKYHKYKEKLDNFGEHLY